MSDKDMDMIKSRIIEQIATNMKSYGYSPTIGRIIAIIYYENRPMGLSELADKTGMSKARMSQVLREMVDLNIAEKVFLKGTRKDMYTVEADYYKMFTTLFTSNWKNVVSRNKKIDASILEDLYKLRQKDNMTTDEKEELERFIHDTLESQQFFHWVDNLVQFLESPELFKIVPIKSKDE